MKHHTKLLVLAAAAVGVAGLATAGWAYWAAGGSGSASATVGTLNPPTGVNLTQPAPATVHVNWTASQVTSTAIAPTGYYVQRLGGAASPEDACGSSLSALLPASPTECDDTVLVGGTYTYTVTAVLWSGSWTAVSGPSESAKVKGSQTIGFTSAAPSAAVVGGPTYTPAATATSGLPVAFTIHGSSSSVCSISNGIVSFTAVGTCTIDANQAGDTNWNAAPQAQQSFTVDKGTQTIAFTSTAPTATVGGPTYTVTATGGASGNPVTFSLNVTSAGCSLAGSTLSFTAAGTCKVDANQAGNANWNAAAQVQQSVTVNAAPSVTTISLATATQTQTGYSQTLTSNGGTGSITWSVTTGSLPIGLSVNTSTGVISGTVDASATSQTFTVAATDNNGVAGTKALSITVNVTPSITTTSLASATKGQVGYSQTLASSGGTGAMTWSVQTGTLPSGLSLAASTGVISGNVSGTATTQTFTVAATDANGVAASESLSITVNPAPIVTVPGVPSAVVHGSAMTINGSGFAFNSTLTVSIKDKNGTVWPVTPTPTTSDGSGNLNGTTGIQVTVPSGVAFGNGNSAPGTVTVTDAVGNTATSASFRIN